MVQKKQIKYILCFISLLFFAGASLQAFRGRGCRGRGGRRGRVIRSGPHSAVRVGFFGSGRGRYRGSGWGYGDRWGRYRGGFFWYSPWDDRRVVVREVHYDDDNDSEGYDEVDQHDEWAENTQVKRYKEDGISIVKVTLPSVDDSFFSKNDIEYPALAAISGAYRLNKRTICKDSPSKTEKLSGIKRIVERVDDLNLFDESRYQSFISDSLRRIKKDRKKRDDDESSDIDELSMTDLESIKKLHSKKVNVGYQGVASSADSLKTAIKEIISNIDDGETEAWALPVYKDGTGWAAVKVEKKDDVVFVVIIRYE